MVQRVSLSSFNFEMIANQGTQTALLAIVPLTQSLSIILTGPAFSVHASDVIQTFTPQQVPTAQTPPTGQSALVTQLGRPSQGVSPLTQKPVPSVMLAQTQLPPGPQEPKLLQVWPVQDLDEQSPFVHVLPAGQMTPQPPQLFGSLSTFTQEEPHFVSPVGQTDTVAVTVTVVVVTGLGAVVVMAVMPQQEQALLYLAAPEQALAYVGTLLGITVTCLCSKAAAWRFIIAGSVVVTVTVVVVVIVLKLRVSEMLRESE